MRRFLSLLLACMLPVMAHAAPETPYDSGLMLRYHTLSSAQRALFDILYAAASAGETTAVLPEGSAYDDTAAALAALMDDCPELCALAPTYRIRYYQTAPDVAVSVELSYMLPLSAQEALLNAAQRLAAEASGDAYDRELYLHDALCDIASYDLNGDDQATAYGALMEGRAGCEGYARALVLLCRLAGIPSGLVTGTAESGEGVQRHTWCIMSVGGVLAQTDPTWNDQEGLGVNTHWYFNLTDAQMGLDHQADEALALPPCTDASASWHARNGWTVPATGGEETIRRALETLVHEKTAVNLRFESTAAAAEFLENLQDNLVKYTGCEGNFLAAASLMQGCVLVLPEK